MFAGVDVSRLLHPLHVIMFVVWAILGCVFQDKLSILVYLVWLLLWFVFQLNHFVALVCGFVLGNAIMTFFLR